MYTFRAYKCIHSEHIYVYAQSIYMYTLRAYKCIRSEHINVYAQSIYIHVYAQSTIEVKFFDKGPENSLKSEYVRLGLHI